MAYRTDSAAPLIDPEGKRLPIKLDSTSNGEFVPVPLSATNRAANRLAHESASLFSKKLSLGRRRFLSFDLASQDSMMLLNFGEVPAGSLQRRRQT